MARCFIWAFLPGWALGCAPPPPAGPPDILLIVVDILRADHVGLYGHERETTPNLVQARKRRTLIEMDRLDVRAHHLGPFEDRARRFERDMLKDDYVYTMIPTS